MKVILNSYFKLGNGEMVTKGACYEGPLEDLPDFVQTLVNENSRHITVVPDPVQKPNKKEPNKKEPDKKEPATKKKAPTRRTAKKPAARRRVVKKDGGSK